jgi:hypothetical protein
MGIGGSPYFRPGNRLLLIENGHTIEIAAVGGVLMMSIDGGADVALGGASFGADTLIRLPNNVPTQVNAGEWILSMPPTGPGTEMSTWDELFLINGVQTIITRFGQSSNVPAQFWGAPADADGMRKPAAHRLQLILGGSTVWECNFNDFDIFLPTRMQAFPFMEAKAASTVASATTITLPQTGNMWVTTGTVAISSIVATGWNPGFKGELIIPATATITHNTVGTGATIMTTSGGTITAGAQGRMVIIAYDGTNWWAQA